MILSYSTRFDFTGLKMSFSKIVRFLRKNTQIRLFHYNSRDYEMGRYRRIIYIPSKCTILVSKRIYSFHSTIPFAISKVLHCCKK